MGTNSLDFRCVKVIAISVVDLERAHKFYSQTLGLLPLYEDGQHVGYTIGETILMLKDNWEHPTKEPNPRVTLQTDDAAVTEKELRSRGVTISDPVEVYDKVHAVGSFLDSEGNKFWYCSYLQEPG
ncbi:MAG: VOC family protein [Verrucomicrobia bacterium]|nr:VOC family protein [Verrucomicrobiota bacterium]